MCDHSIFYCYYFDIRASRKQWKALIWRFWYKYMALRFKISELIIITKGKCIKLGQNNARNLYRKWIHITHKNQLVIRIDGDLFCLPILHFIIPLTLISLIQLSLGRLSANILLCPNHRPAPLLTQKTYSVILLTSKFGKIVNIN